MIISVIVKAGAKENKLEKIANNSFKAIVKAPKEAGKANQAVIELLAKYFNVTKKEVILKFGYKSKNKIFIIGG